MSPAPLARRDPRLDGLRVLVVGLGRSGAAAARLAASRGARVLAVDRREEAEVERTVRELSGLPIEIRCGGHPAALAGATDLVVVSPGVRRDEPLLEAARAAGVPVWGELELAGRFRRGRVVAVTGSNGKSTTTAMAGAILRGAGFAGGTGGNLGTPLSDLLDVDRPGAVHAVEVSSFQLETTESFAAEIAVVLNLRPDHLDRHGGLDAYAAAKRKLLELQDASGQAILNSDDPGSAAMTTAVRGDLYRFSTRSEVDRGAFLRRGILVLRTVHGEDRLLDADNLPVPGEHNVANALAAALACRLAGAPPEAIADGLRAYRALPHRLERVVEVGGVVFYDDSKATNLDAAERALRSFPEGRVHVILGGRDKGADWEELAPSLRRFARRVLLVGESADRIERAVPSGIPIVRCGTVPAAVRAGHDGAAPGDVVLLSPGCASFDQYRNFEERGLDFANAARSLAGGEDGRA